jgi:protein phosphatase 1G
MGAYLSSPITTKEVVAGQGSHFHYGIASHQGWRKTQEDAHIAEAITDEYHLFAVLDGHGGAEVAKFVAACLPQELKSLDHFQQGKLAESLIASFHRMDQLMLSEQGRAHLDSFRPKNEYRGTGSAQEDAIATLRKIMALNGQATDKLPNSLKLSGGNQEAGGGGAPSEQDTSSQAGCTAVVALVTKKIVVVANAGDSRAVLSRDRKAVPLSHDHKPSHVDERERIVAAGGFVSDIGGICRVNGNLSLSRAIGDLRYKTNTELEPAAQIITAEPDILTVELTPEDQFMVLACDGIWDVLENQEVVDFILARLGEKKPEEIASELLDHCLASDPRESRGKGCDNMTCCIVQFKQQ